MPELHVGVCSTRMALEDMLETASRRLIKAIRVTGSGGALAREQSIEKAEAGVAGLTQRLMHHRGVHHCC